VIVRHADHCEYLLFEHLHAAQPVAHGVFTRKGGYSGPPFNGLNCSITVGDTHEAVRLNHAVIIREVGMPLVSARIAHGNTIAVIERTSPDEPLDEVRARLRATVADAMITTEQGLGLFWAFADCSPMIFYDPQHQVVALAHGGWRGAAGAIAPRTLQTMRERFGTRPEETLVGVGPAIKACCYEVNEAVREQFAAADPIARDNAVFEERPTLDASDDGKPHLFLDITASNVGQLLAAGILPEHLEVVNDCTGCTGLNRFYSHRQEPAVDGRFGVVIGLR